MYSGIIVCTRMGSQRVGGKAKRRINGVPLLRHLHERLSQTKLPIVYAYPGTERAEFEPILSKFRGDYLKFEGSEDDPLDRMARAQAKFGFENIIRVTHDKIFVEPLEIFEALKVFREQGADYLFSSTQTDGCGFEIIRDEVLREAAERWKKVEHISYAVRALSDHVIDYSFQKTRKKDVRLLLDFDSDFDLFEVLFSSLGNTCTRADVFKFLDENSWAKRMNQLPLATIYTVGFNASSWIEQCMRSVSHQDIFGRIEYVLIDDHSSDDTFYRMSKFASIFQNVRAIRMPTNFGLASGSNKALGMAKGKFIVRLDADDYFTEKDSVSRLISYCDDNEFDVVYPDNYFGDVKVIQRGYEHHHVGGALFRTRAINHVKFTDGLRGHDSYDVFLRAKDQLKIGYLQEPVFFYRQHEGSLTRNNLKEREKLRRQIEERNGYKGLLQ